VPKPTVPPAAIAHLSLSPSHATALGTAQASPGRTTGFGPPPRVAFLPSSFSQRPCKAQKHQRLCFVGCSVRRRAGGTGSPPRGTPRHPHVWSLNKCTQMCQGPLLGATHNRRHPQRACKVNYNFLLNIHPLLAQILKYINII